MTHMEVATRTVDGISLRQRLRSDLRRMDRGEEFFRMGKSYFENLQVAYVHNFEIAQMRPDHDGEHVPDELILALMEATRDHHPDGCSRHRSVGCSRSACTISTARSFPA